MANSSQPKNLVSGASQSLIILQGKPSEFALDFQNNDMEYKPVLVKEVDDDNSLMSF